MNHLSKSSLKVFATVLLIVIAVLAYDGALERGIEKTPVGSIDQGARDYFDTALKRAIVTFAVAKGLNAAISALQGTQISATPAGVGITFSVGEVLDPINDLIESFSTVMLVSTASLGIQKILLEIGIWLGFTVFLTASIILLLISIWLPASRTVTVRSIGFKLLFASIIIRFCIPTVGMASGGIFTSFLEQTYENSTESLTKLKSNIQDQSLTEGDTISVKENPGVWDKAKSIVESGYAMVNIKSKFDALRDMVSNASTYIVNLIVVFCLQTIIIPIVVLWGLIKSTALFFSPNGSNFLGTTFSDALAKSLRGIKKQVPA